MRIELVDPRDDADFGRWFLVLRAVEEDTRPGEPGWQPRDQQAMAVAGSDRSTAVGELLTLLVAVEGDVVLGIGRLLLTIYDNTDRARVLVFVHPDHRRRGVGAALLEALLERARAAGCTTTAGEIDEPGRTAGRSPARAFAAKHGFTCALMETRRDLELPAEPERLAQVAAAVSPYGMGFEVRRYRDHCPDDLLNGRAALGTAMSVMYPAGDLAVEAEVWDADRLRRTEQMYAEMGRHYFAAVALRDGEAVAFTELGLNVAAPERAYQWDTLVLPEHRGRRLGTVLKLAVLDELQRTSPQTRLVTTWNADVNAPMIAVNEALGFRPNGTLSTWHRPL